MSARPRIALIHATPVAIEPVVAAFARGWPEAELANILDDSLAADRAKREDLAPEMFPRFGRLAAYAVDHGARGILFTCSAFGTAIDAAKKEVRVPVLKPNEAMIEDALAAGAELALLTTFEPSIPSLKKELEELATGRGIKLKLKTRSIPAAIAALQQGHGAEHDRLIAAAAAELPPCDALVLGQFSMARAAAGIAMASGRKVLTSPHSAVSKLKRIFDAR